MPDEKLLAAAKSGSLGTPDGLRQVVTWMLKDKKARGLLDGFAEQWLGVRHLAKAAPSKTVYPSFNDGVRRRYGP